MNKTTYEEYLAEHGELTLTNVGVSMLPMLKQGRDMFTLTKKTEKRCEKYDVVLYRVPPNRYVLHRIVEVREHDYVILGDNCMNKEYGIKDEDIIAVLTRFVHNGKEYSVEDTGYMNYAKAWYSLYPLRREAKKIKAKIRGVIRKK
ncbi:MAG: S24/S26 family peptidase [Clostridia bacterium]|nr:S24/S26 family peptidase [Clostridia bacterium]